MCGCGGVLPSRMGLKMQHGWQQWDAPCCESCAMGGPCEGAPAGEIECASGACGIPRRPAPATRAQPEERASAGVFSDRFASQGARALQALLAWRGITAATWFASGAANRDSWAQSWVATLGTMTAAERREITSAVLAVGASELARVAGGGTTRTGTTTTGGDAVPANWASMTAAERQAWARQYADAHGLSAEERAELEERSRTADRALIAGLVQQGVSVVLALIRARSEERIAEIEANARRAASDMTSTRDSERNLLNAMNGGGGGGSTGTSYGKKRSSSTALGIAALAVLAAKAL